MALKKRKATTRSEGEQLYMLEILADGLELCPVKSVGNGEQDSMVRVGFVDLAPVDIIVEEFVKAEDGGRGGKSKRDRFPDKRTGRREPGKTCLFVRTPSNLIGAMKSIPLSVEVYRTSHLPEDRNSRDDDRTLLCAATAFLPACFCDRVAAARGKIDGLPSSCTARKVYTLTDEHGSPCGFVSIHLRLSCFGSAIIGHIALREKSFALPGFPLGGDFREDCARARDREPGTEDSSAFLLNEILGAARCSKSDDRETTGTGTTGAASTALTRPESPPRVSMDQPGFERLTNAEKLNDPKYRGLIYETYPDEPTCACLPIGRSTHPLACRSGCARSCCSALRNPDILRENNNNDDDDDDDNDDVPSPSATPATRCVTLDDLRLGATYARDTSCCYATRMRGGGENRENLRSSSEVLWNEACQWSGDNVDLINRLKGGSEHGYVPCEGTTTTTTTTTTTVIYQKGKGTMDASSCRPRPRTADAAKAACVCPGKDQSYWRTGTTGCTKKPCMGADCLLRAFKEAQDFVDSLGKVPGLVGLGLMDPSESPYFGRDLDKDYVVHAAEAAPPSEKKPRGAYPAAAQPGLLQCTAPCNTQIGRPGVTAGVSVTPYVAPAVPGRTGVVREAIPALPAEATLTPVAMRPRKKEEKKEEKTEKQKELDVTATVPADVDVGPCGEPRCKSRRKVPGDAVPSRETVEEAPSKKPAVRAKPPDTIVAKAVGKHGERPTRHPRGKPGPGGDRDAAKVPIRVSKRVMRYVYTIGDVYPGIHFGHKNCVDPRMRVPANMGWLWNTRDIVGKLKPRIGWKPGAIGRYLHELLKEAKAGSLEEDESRPRSVPSRTTGRRGRVYKTTSYASVKKLQAKKEGEEEAEPPPTLHIHRKDGTYYVTMYPIKQETTEVPQLDEPTKPLQFKIVKNRDDASAASSSTASDMEIEFSPPAAVNRYRKKPDVIHVDTQVRQQEILDAFKPAEAPKKREKKEKKEKRARRK